MVFREAEKTDMPAIAEINIACVPNGTRAKWGVALTARFYECYFLENGPFIVAEENGTLAGYVMGYYKGSTARAVFEQSRGNPAVGSASGDLVSSPAGAYDSVLLSLAVLPEYAGRGIAKELVSSFLKLVRSSGKAANGCVETQVQNIPAQHVYQACGYTEILRDSRSVWYELIF